MEIYTLKELQEKELQILIDFDRFCNQHDLRYYLIGGALLGAARYQEFIPWDDDVDVAMPRDDYERLKEVFVSDRYFLQNDSSDPVFSRCIQKIRLNDTVIAEKNCIGLNIHQGIYIDVFPIDYVSSCCHKTLNRRAALIRRLMSLRMIKGGYKSDRHTFVKKAIRYLLPCSINYIDRTLFRLCTMENNGDCRYAILWLHNYPWYKQIHSLDVFGDGGKCQFCGCDFSAPADTDAFLRRVFGKDYMEEPPLEKQQCPHNYINIKTVDLDGVQ